jgi:hypothetical protein
VLTKLKKPNSQKGRRQDKTRQGIKDIVRPVETKSSCKISEIGGETALEGIFFDLESEKWVLEVTGIPIKRLRNELFFPRCLIWVEEGWSRI